MTNSVYDRIKYLCKINKTNISRVETECGMANSTIKKWRNSTTPGIDKIIKVAQFFHVSTDYLLGLSETPNSNLWMTDRRTQYKTFPLDERFGSLEASDTDISVIRILNFAATVIVASQYFVPEMHAFKQYFDRHIALGTHIDLIITDPESFAAEDAGKKMKNPFFVSDQQSAIPFSNNKLNEMIINDLAYYNAFNSKRFQVFKTGVALPYAITQIEHKPEASSKDSLRVDLYSPYLSSGNDRRSFTVFKASDPENYSFFQNSLREIMYDSKQIAWEEIIAAAHK